MPDHEKNFSAPVAQSSRSATPDHEKNFSAPVAQSSRSATPDHEKTLRSRPRPRLTRVRAQTHARDAQPPTPNPYLPIPSPQPSIPNLRPPASNAQPPAANPNARTKNKIYAAHAGRVLCSTIFLAGWRARFVSR